MANNLHDDSLYKSGHRKITKCPICGEDTLDYYYICDNCGWEYDEEISKDGYSPANNTTIEEYKKEFYKL